MQRQDLIYTGLSVKTAGHLFCVRPREENGLVDKQMTIVLRSDLDPLCYA